MTYAQALIAAKAARAHAAHHAAEIAARGGWTLGEPASVRHQYRSAARRVRIRRSGRAAQVWHPGYGENTPLSAIFPPAA